MNILVIGNLGAGKSTVIRHLEQLTNAPLVFSQGALLREFARDKRAGITLLPQGHSSFLVQDKALFDEADELLLTQIAEQEFSANILLIELVWRNPSRWFPSFLRERKAPTVVWYVTTSNEDVRLAHIQQRNRAADEHFLTDAIIDLFPNMDDYFLPLIQSQEYAPIELIENTGDLSALYARVEELYTQAANSLVGTT